LQVPRREIMREMQDWRLEPTERRLARMADQARAVAARLEKNVRVQFESNGVRVERTELVGLWSTLVHVVRNAIDHGVEGEDERVAAGKPAQGVLTLETSLEGDELVFRAEDDGRGIDWGRVRAQAREMGLAFATAQDLQEAIFSSGFSTRDTASEHSGRGIGLHAVSAICKELGGSVRIESVTGRGACVEIRIPRRRDSERESPKLSPVLAASTSARGQGMAVV
jgi:chemotaxis protein histidine kinase CheA